jgi:hypothetical protein
MKSNLPTSPSPAAPTDEPVTTEDGIGLAHAQSWPKAGLPDFGAHLDTPCSSASHLPLIPPVGVTEAAKAPLFAVGDTVRVIHPENYPSDIRAGDTTEGTVTHILPDIRKRFVYVCSPIGSWFENQIERVAVEAPAPVSPSLPEPDLLETLNLSATLARDLLYGPERKQTAIELNAQLSVIIPAFATLKADVERLRDLLEQAHDDLAVTYKAIEIHGGPDVSVGQFRRLDQYKAAALSLAEVGRK